MRPGPRAGPGALLSARILLILPLVLAAVALLLQLTGGHDPGESDAFDLFNERAFIERANRLPRLERQLRRTDADMDATFHRGKAPLPEGLNGVRWEWPGGKADGPSIAFIVTTAESVDQIRVWMAYHRALGVSTFYLFVEGQANSAEAHTALRAEPGVTVTPSDADLMQRHAGSRIWNESWLSAFFNKPCNNELFVRQSLNMEIGIQMAIRDRVEWLLHIDTDELLFPGGTRDFSLARLMATVPASVDLLVFPNYESLAETTDVEDPFTEVSLFKRSYSHVISDTYFANYAAVARGNPNYFTTYGNGKSAARVRPGLRPNGAHRWHNYFKAPKEWSSDQAAVLHYTFNRFSDLKARRDRCDCKPTEEDAERCFILPFDRLAFLEASLKTDDQLMEFFKERLVWGDAATVVELQKKGLFSRLYEPQLMVRGLREAMKRQREEEAAAQKKEILGGNSSAVVPSETGADAAKQRGTAAAVTGSIASRERLAGQRGEEVVMAVPQLEEGVKSAAAKDVEESPMLAAARTMARPVRVRGTENRTVAQQQQQR